MRCIGLFEHLCMNMRNYNYAGFDWNQRGHNGNRLVCAAFGKKCGVQVTSNYIFATYIADIFATITEIRWFDYSCMSIQNCNCAGFNNGQNRHSANRLMSNTFGSRTLTRIVDISAAESVIAWFEYLILKMESANNSTLSNANTSHNSTTLTTPLSTTLTPLATRQR